MSALLVTDTTGLIALDRIERLDVLPRLYAPVVAPPAVVREFGRRPAWLDVEAPNDDKAVAALRRRLDPGEAEAIVVARRIPNAALLIDEARGRRVATDLGLAIIGTAGILLGAKRAGLVPHVKPLLDDLRENHAFLLSQTLYAWAIEQAGEG